MAKSVTPPNMGPVRYQPDENEDPDYAAVREALMRVAGVVGVGETKDDIGNDAWIAYVTDNSAVRNVPQRMHGRKVVVHISGPVDAYSE